MKKLFFLAAMAALIFASCTKEKGVDSNDPLLKGGTYASFSFPGLKMPNPASRATADFNAVGIADDVKESDWGYGDLYILIFDAAGALTYFGEVDASPYKVMMLNRALLSLRDYFPLRFAPSPFETEGGF